MMNAIIMAAGTASRFVPLSEEFPKGLLEVKGEILIERQIRQLQEAGIRDITVVTGYKAGMFSYLGGKYGVSLVFNEDFRRYNNTSSLIRVLDRLGDTFICCSDHYFSRNVFSERPAESYYACKFAHGKTNEYCLRVDSDDFIKGVTVGGQDSWYMAGHVFFSEDFSSKFKSVMKAAYSSEKVRNGYWEDVYIGHINELPMKIRRYQDEDIFEFDTLDELRQFDASYCEDTRSSVIRHLSDLFRCSQKELHDFRRIGHEGDYLAFSFKRGEEEYVFDGRDSSITHFWS